MPLNIPTDVSVITTYRCQMQCQMCNIWKNPSLTEKEITAKDLEKLPHFKFANITGGEPFLRDDLEEIIAVMYTKADRIVISTSGWHYDKVELLAKKFPSIGIRVSIEGLSAKNDELRGRDGGFDRGIKTLNLLRGLGVKDIGFGITVSNYNSADMLELYELSKKMRLEFATAAFHNGYYFHKFDNMITNKDEVIGNFRILIDNLLHENNPKSWFRAFFNLGLINYIEGNRRMLPCEAGSTNFFIDPCGELYPCNALEESIWKESMGNIHEASSFDEIWNSAQADKVRTLVRKCPKNCWMVGTVAPVMKKYLRHPLGWVVKNKLRNMAGKHVCVKNIPHYNVGQDPRQGDLNYSRIRNETD